MTASEPNPVDHERLLREAMRPSAAAPAGAPAPKGPDELAPHFPDFEILALIGRGGMGAVYKAVQRRLGRVVALKVLPEHLAREPEFGERFQREARALAALNHPHVLTVHDFGVAGGMHYLVTEFVDGVDLRQLMALGELSPAEALRITPQICTALQSAHEHGVVHRDVKPENILIDTQGQVKIADFGLAKLTGAAAGEAALTRSTAVFGTPHYMAPEQWRGSGTVDHRADIYALGVVLYEMLTGELPIGHFDPPSKRHGVPRGLDEVVRKALAQQPENRYQQVREVQTDVELQGRTKPRTPEPKAVPAGGRLAKGPFVAVGLLLLGLAALGAAIFVIESGERLSHRATIARTAYDTTVAAIAESARRDVAWTGELPMWPSAPPAPVVSSSIVRLALLIGVPALLLAIVGIGFGSVRRIRNSGGAVTGLPLAVTTAWLVPIGLVVGLAFAPIAAIRDHDTRVLAGLVLGAALTAGAVRLLVRETRRQRELVRAGVRQGAGAVRLAVGLGLAVVVPVGALAFARDLAPEPVDELAVPAPILARDLVGRPASFVLDRLGPPLSITADQHGSCWTYEDAKGSPLEFAVTLSGDHVLGTDARAVVLMPSGAPRATPYTGQRVDEVVRERGAPRAQAVGAIGRELTWSDGLRIREKDGRVVGVVRD